MQVKSTYQKDRQITITCEDFDPTETTCQKLQQMLESSKFALLKQELSWQWQRQEFNADRPKATFEFWLAQVTKLCEKYGNEPVEVSLETSYESIVNQLNQLQEEIATLKKFDCAATEKLQHLREQLLVKEEGRRKEEEGKEGGRLRK